MKTTQLAMTFAMCHLPAGAIADEASQLIGCLSSSRNSSEQIEACLSVFNAECLGRGNFADKPQQTACYKSFGTLVDEIGSQAKAEAAQEPQDFNKRYLSATWKLVKRQTEAGCDFVVETSRAPGVDLEEDALTFAQCYANTVAKAFPGIAALPGEKE